MKNRLILVFIALVLIIGNAALTYSEKEKKTSLSPTIQTQENILYKTFNLSEEVNVSIKFRDKNRLKIQSIEKNKREIRELNFLEYEDLKKNNQIEEIYVLKKYYPALQDSVGIVQANNSWNLKIGLNNLTGKDQTVCIIDTGINFSHSDLGGCFGNNNASSTCKIIGGWNTFLNNNNISDLNGHGTHVSGIVAANGSIRGVAPDAKIIIMKAYDDLSNSFEDIDIEEAINWCVANRTLFNISVISMSLGVNCTATPQYCSVSFCNSDYLASSINNAVANNISVVISSGNNGYANVISSPGCIQNATPVTSSNKEDSNISSFANTWNNSSLILLTAPGENINSTWKNGLYESLEGTSMAAPHVSGAILILRQFLQYHNEYLSPKEIEGLLNDSGKQIYDSYANRSFSRISVYDAVLNMSSFAQNNFPNNNTYTNLNTVNFSCNVSTYRNFNWLNVTFYLWNSTNELINSSTSNITGQANSSEFNFNFSSEQEYKWNCVAFNNATNLNFSSDKFTIIYDSTAPQIENITESVSSTSATINWDTSESTNASATTINQNQTNSSFSTNHAITWASLSSSTVYEYNITSCDLAGNCKSIDETFTTSAAPVQNSPSSGGGGGGSSSPPTLFLSSEEISKGTSKIVNSGGSIKLKVSSQNHTLTLNNAINNSANITVRSDPINFVLNIGEDKKLNLSSSDYYDLSIVLENISGGKANLTIKEINELRVSEKNFLIPNETNDGEKKVYYPAENNFTETKNYSRYVVILVFIVIVYCIVKRKGFYTPKSPDNNGIKKSKIASKRKR